MSVLGASASVSMVTQITLDTILTRLTCQQRIEKSCPDSHNDHKGFEFSSVSLKMTHFASSPVVERNSLNLLQWPTYSIWICRQLKFCVGYSHLHHTRLFASNNQCAGYTRSRVKSSSTCLAPWIVPTQQWQRSRGKSEISTGYKIRDTHSWTNRFFFSGTTNLFYNTAKTWSTFWRFMM